MSGCAIILVNYTVQTGVDHYCVLPGSKEIPESKDMMKIAIPTRLVYTLGMLLLAASALSGCTRERDVLVDPSADTALVEDNASTGGAANEPNVLLVPVVEDTATPEPEPTATETPVVSTIPYQVQPGDTVSTVAEKFGVTSQELRQLNLLSTDALQVGQVLRVPNTPGLQTSEATPAAPTGPFEYVVQEGDSLLSIALRFGVTTNDIIVANTLADPNSVFVGQELIIPGYQPEVPPTPVPPQPYEYVIQSGDTLFSIAQQFNVTAQTIVDANTLRDPDNLIQGQVLIIPGYQGTATTGRTGEADTTTTTSASNAIHVVRAGESLLAIAQLYAVSAADIVAANQLANPDQIQPGQELIIPGIDADQVQSARQTRHTVASGETLFSIAQQYNVSASAILKANNLTNPNFITVGQQLIIPTEE